MGRETAVAVIVNTGSNENNGIVAGVLLLSFSKSYLEWTVPASSSVQVTLLLDTKYMIYYYVVLS
jgi:hypothetical protein